MELSGAEVEDSSGCDPHMIHSVMVQFFLWDLFTGKNREYHWILNLSLTSCFVCLFFNNL